MNMTQKFKNPVPDHVPMELVKDFRQEDAEGFDKTPYKVYKELRESSPDIFWSTNTQDGKGQWIVKSMELVREIFQNPEIFSTCPKTDNHDHSTARPEELLLVPLEMDPPDHTTYRNLLQPILSPKAINGPDMRENIIRTANELIDGFYANGECEFMRDFARVLPGTVFINLLGLPLEEKDKFFDWIENFFHGETKEIRDHTGMEIMMFLANEIKKRKEDPKSDFMTRLTKITLNNGDLISDQRILDICFFLFIAGLDTVAASLGHVFKYLAENPEKKEILIESPDKINLAVEEMIRWHSWVNVPRYARIDTELGGVKIKKGDAFLLVLTMANHDPLVFEDPDEVDFSRKPNPHMGFSGGIHRCIGSHLARREIVLAVTEWLKRAPDFRLKEGADITYNTQVMFSPASLPLVWDVK